MSTVTRAAVPLIWSVLVITHWMLVKLSGLKSLSSIEPSSPAQTRSRTLSMSLFRPAVRVALTTLAGESDDRVTSTTPTPTTARTATTMPMITRGFRAHPGLGTGYWAGGGYVGGIPPKPGGGGGRPDTG